MTQLEGLVTIITGAASGLGEATARRFVRDGATVIMSDIQQKKGEAISSEIGAEFLAADVTEEKQIADLVDQALARHGRLDCMINNAGALGVVGGIATISSEDWNKTVSLLLGSVFYGMKHAARAMINQGDGCILSTTSVAGLVAMGPHAYTAAKHGVVGLTKSVASELARYGVRVNAVAPGTVPTDMTGQIYGGQEGVRETSKARNPLGRSVEAADIAGGFAYLAGPDGKNITGQILTIDAGQSACPAPNRYY
ncbi:MAG: SDR family oxidoreductase [Alphaproteobacteria bacterium]|nr:MAG: SDR family oxidoreductase [Alphaproteobacteria bacterium]